mgnify:CR=1 FL=1
MEIKLNTAYASTWDNVEYPIYQLADNSYLCISYSMNHHCFGINIYTTQQFEEQGFHESYWPEFDNITAEDLDRSYVCKG